MIKWLPKLVLFDDSNGIWENYIDKVYSYFKDDFIDKQTFYKGIRIALRKHPITNGKEKAFWHLVSTGAREDERNTDIRRCERIRWPRPILEHFSSGDIYVWQNERGSEKRVLLYMYNERYLVVLGIRRGYFLLCTAYYVEYTHRHDRLIQEYLEYSHKKS